MSHTIKTAISMPQNLYDTVMEYADGGKFSTTVCELLRKALFPDGGAPVQVPEDVIAPLRRRIDALEDIQKNVLQSNSEIMTSLNSLMNNMDGHHGHSCGCASEVSNSGSSPDLYAVRQISNRIQKNNRILITDEMRVQMSEKIQRMKKVHNLKLIEIAQILMIPGKQRVTEISTGVLKSIPQDGYDALMAWTP